MMRITIGKLYAIALEDGHKFSAMCTEVENDYVIFESKSGIQTRHHINDIIAARDLSKSKPKATFTCNIGKQDPCFGCPKFDECQEEYEYTMEMA
jgi:hypothetical protein